MIYLCLFVLSSVYMYFSPSTRKREASTQTEVSKNSTGTQTDPEPPDTPEVFMEIDNSFFVWE